ncbi:MAG: type II secretion system major pseudopilin GspG [Deltaproteobacteria bacterium]|nr:type II secretion system major pseudopilin GspG [Deltaproteobacteria bacterium]
MLKHILTSQRGMTLIEIIVVITIMAIIASLAGTQVINRLEDAKISTTKTQMKTLQQALEMYKADNDYYPTTEQGLEALIQTPTTGNVPQNYPTGGYIDKKKLPVDGWGAPFTYLSENGEAFTLISYGKDKKEGGTGRAADISSDDL